MRFDACIGWPVLDHTKARRVKLGLQRSYMYVSRLARNMMKLRTGSDVRGT